MLRFNDRKMKVQPLEPGEVAVVLIGSSVSEADHSVLEDLVELFTSKSGRVDRYVVHDSYGTDANLNTMRTVREKLNDRNPDGKAIVLDVDMPMLASMDDELTNAWNLTMAEVDKALDKGLALVLELTTVDSVLYPKDISGKAVKAVVSGRPSSLYSRMLNSELDGSDGGTTMMDLRTGVSYWVTDVADYQFDEDKTIDDGIGDRIHRSVNDDRAPLLMILLGLAIIIGLIVGVERNRGHGHTGEH